MCQKVTNSEKLLIVYYYFQSIKTLFWFWTIQSQLGPLWIEASEAVYSRHDCSNERETESWGGERRKGVLRINLSRWNKKTQMAWLAEWMGAQTTDHQWSLNRRKPKCFGTNSDVKRRFVCPNLHSKSYQLPFDQRVQIVIPPRSPVSVPEPIGTPSDGIFHRSDCCLFRQCLGYRIYLSKSLVN